MEQQKDAQKDNVKLKVTLRGLDCPDCAANLEKAVQGLPDVAHARLIYATAELTVETDRARNVLPEVQRLADQMGFEALDEEALAAATEAPPDGFAAWFRRNRQLVTTATSGILLLTAAILGWLGGPVLASRILYGLAIAAGGFYLARAGWTTLRTARTLDMNVLMVVAAIGAMFVGEYAEGAVTIFLFSIGELLESYTSDRARNAIRSLMELAPPEATVERDGQAVVVPVEELQHGERVLVRPGERFPVDGRVVEGRSAVNQAPITGESIPVEKEPGGEVFAGTINGSGALTVEVTRVAEDSTIARILRMVSEAQSERAPAQRLVDRFAAVYTPIVLGLAVLIATVPPLVGLGAFDAWLYRALVLLVISCPCALVISTPVTIVSALTRAARSGVLIKGGRHLEALASLQVMAFDKTGTLTAGEPYVVGGACELHGEMPDYCENCVDLLAKAAALEGRSEHALARAVTRSAEAAGLMGRYAPSEETVAHAGLGIEGRVGGHVVSAGSLAFSRRNGDGHVSDDLARQVREAEAQGYTVVLVEDACCNQSCYLAIADTLRPEAAGAVRGVKDAGVAHTVMLTGDNPHIAAQIAETAGVDDFYASLLPEDKVTAIERLEAERGRTAMVGDGVNDAPAMAKATVGIAMGAAGTDTALETADVALMGDDLSRLPYALRLSRSALAVVRQNVAASLAIKAVFLGLAIAGISTLWMAVLADTGASILVTLNGMRMLRYRE